MGFTELILFAVIALVFIGPKQLPEMARVLARTLNEFKRATGDLTKPMADLKKQATKELENVSDSLKVDSMDMKIQEEFDKLEAKVNEAETPETKSTDESES